jgi:DNA-binding transcriptional MerR regulator
MATKHESSRTFSLDELCALAELPKRTVRYYMQIGLLDRPQGEKRGAYYLASHVDQLLRIRKLTQSGVSLERIREVLSGEPVPVPVRPRGPGSVEVWSHLVVADGVEVTIEPGRAGLSPEQVRQFFRAVLARYEAIKQEQGDVDQ